LDLNRRFKLVEELLDVGERRAGHKSAGKKVRFLPFDPYLAKLSLLSVNIL
jgi:hypothetical protein